MTAGPRDGSSVTRRVLGSLQKAAEYVEYRARRSKMLLDIARLRRAHRRVFRGRVDRILVVRLGSLGDVVRATAVVRELRQQYPSSTIDFLTSAASRVVFEGSSDLSSVHTVSDLPRLGPYDWVVNLQNPAPLEAFLDGTGLAYQDVLSHLSTRLGARFITGRHIRDGREVSPTDIHFCLAEFEEILLTALLDYDPGRYPRTSLQLDAGLRERAVAGFGLTGRAPLLGVFLGTNSIGCGADEGYRTYSMAQFGRLVRHFSSRFTVVVFGQSRMRSASELEEYRGLLAACPGVIDLVDRTSLMELVAVIDRCTAIITCDSSPVHLANARGVPVVAMYVNDATFRLGPVLENEHFVALNSVSPCFHYSKRWKFFCADCRAPETRAWYCRGGVFTFGIDRIPLDAIDRAVARLISTREATRA